MPSCEGSIGTGPLSPSSAGETSSSYEIWRSATPRNAIDPLCISITPGVCAALAGGCGRSCEDDDSPPPPVWLCSSRRRRLGTALTRAIAVCTAAGGQQGRDLVKGL